MTRHEREAAAAALDLELIAGVGRSYPAEAVGTTTAELLAALHAFADEARATYPADTADERARALRRWLLTWESVRPG